MNTEKDKVKFKGYCYMVDINDAQEFLDSLLSDAAEETENLSDIINLINGTPDNISVFRVSIKAEKVFELNPKPKVNLVEDDYLGDD